MITLCLFDIYRGVFAQADKRIQSSAVTSEVQASAKLSLLAYLLEQIKMNYLEKESKEDSRSVQQADMALKAFLGDLVTGMHQEIVSDGKFSTKDY